MPQTLKWLEPGDPFPSVESAWADQTDAPGLLAAGGDLTVDTLMQAYAQGIFPWFGEDQPILWWSPHPRMVLNVSRFKLHRSLRKTLQRFKTNANCEIRIDTAFAQVIRNCAESLRQGRPGTWIVPSMVNAYVKLHHAGAAHSVETWINGQLVGGLYCVAIGNAVFGESMFTKVPDASKIALAALICLCRENAVELIDCQQNTAHLASLGATEMDRNTFIASIQIGVAAGKTHWHFDPLYWRHVLSV